MFSSDPPSIHIRSEGLCYVMCLDLQRFWSLPCGHSMSFKDSGITNKVQLPSLLTNLHAEAHSAEKYLPYLQSEEGRTSGWSSCESADQILEEKKKKVVQWSSDEVRDL